LNVLIIPEHFSQDQHILKPIVKAMFGAIGRPRANVQVCQDPLLGNVDQAMRWERLREIIDIYPQVDLFLLIVDRDGEERRRLRLNHIERQATEILSVHRHFLAEHAWQEIEVWALAGCDDLPRDWSWRAVRSERDPKESFFEPYVRRRGLQNEPGGGRRTLGREAAHRYSRIRRRCPEVAGLEMRIQRWLSSARRA
jgi:hypothetical protein